MLPRSARPAQTDLPNHHSSLANTRFDWMLTYGLASTAASHKTDQQSFAYVRHGVQHRN